MEDTSDWDAQAHLAKIAARRGGRTEVEEGSEKLASIHQPYLFGAVSYERAAIAALAGMHKDAVTLLRQAFAEGFPFVHELHIDQDFEPLHGYPLFEELLRPKGGD